MKKVILVVVGLLVLSGCGMKKGRLLTEHTSQYDIKETVARFTKAVEAKGYKYMRTTDHSALAKAEAMYLKPVVSLEFAHDKISTALLSCNPSMAIEMPIRVAVYQELGGAIKLAYAHPEFWSLKHNIKDKNCIEVVLQIARDLDGAATAIAP